MSLCLSFLFCPGFVFVFILVLWSFFLAVFCVHLSGILKASRSYLLAMFILLIAFALFIYTLSSMRYLANISLLFGCTTVCPLINYITRVYSNLQRTFFHKIWCLIWMIPILGFTWYFETPCESHTKGQLRYSNWGQRRALLSFFFVFSVLSTMSVLILQVSHRNVKMIIVIIDTCERKPMDISQAS